MRRLLLFLIFTNSVIYSCKYGNSDVNTKAQSISIIFNKYIDSTFPDVEFQDTSIIFIIPDRYCISCKKLTTELLESYGQSSNIYIIASSDNFLQNSIKNEILTDKSGKYNNLDLGVNSSAYIIRINKEIHYISEINYTSVDKINELFKTYAIKSLP